MTCPLLAPRHPCTWQRWTSSVCCRVPIYGLCAQPVILNLCPRVGTQALISVGRKPSPGEAPGLTLIGRS